MTSQGADVGDIDHGAETEILLESEAEVIGLLDGPVGD